MVDLIDCDRCKRPAKVRALYYRDKAGVARLAGRLGKECFYILAGQIARQGYQPEHEDARVVRLRRRR